MKLRQFAVGLAALCVAVMCTGSMVQAEPIKANIDLDSTFALGSRYDADSSVWSREEFRVPWGQDYFLYVAPEDTGSVEGGDTLVFALMKAVDWGNTAPELLDGARRWTLAYAFAAVANQGSNFPLTKYIPYDSLAVYPIGGRMRWVCYEGSTEDATDAIGSDQKYDCYIECKGKD